MGGLDREPLLLQKVNSDTRTGLGFARRENPKGKPEEKKGLWCFSGTQTRDRIQGRLEEASLTSKYTSAHSPKPPK